jgi:hypothetical protein
MPERAARHTRVVPIGEEALGVDHPGVGAQCLELRLPTGLSGGLGLSGQIQLAFVLERLQGVEVLLAEDPGHSPEGKQEVLGRTPESAAVVLQHAAGDDAVYVRVAVQGLAQSSKVRNILKCRARNCARSWATLKS